MTKFLSNIYLPYTTFLLPRPFKKITTSKKGIQSLESWRKSSIWYQFYVREYRDGPNICSRPRSYHLVSLGLPKISTTFYLLTLCHQVKTIFDIQKLKLLYWSTKQLWRIYLMMNWIRRKSSRLVTGVILGLLNPDFIHHTEENLYWKMIERD